MPRTLSRVMTMLLALLCSVALAACGQSSTDTSFGDSGPTRTITNADKSTADVPVDPQRVVTLSEPATDAAFALGFTPVGLIAGRGQDGVANYLKDQAGDIPVVGTVSQLNYEAIGNLQPDLIITDGTAVNNRPDVLEILRQIAPVAFTGYAGGDWRYNFTHIADALNMAEEGEEVLAAYDARAEELKQRLANEGLDQYTYSIVRWQVGAPALILKELPAGRALEDVGLPRPANQDREGQGHSDPVSLENLADIDADYMFLGTLGGSSVSNPNAGGVADLDSAKEAVEEAAETPGFTDLTAYKEGHVIPVDGSVWTTTGSATLMNTILNDIESALLADADTTADAA